MKTSLTLERKVQVLEQSIQAEGEMPSSPIFSSRSFRNVPLFHRTIFTLTRALVGARDSSPVAVQGLVLFGGGQGARGDSARADTKQLADEAIVR